MNNDYSISNDIDKIERIFMPFFKFTWWVVKLSLFIVFLPIIIPIGILMLSFGMSHTFEIMVLWLLYTDRVVVVQENDYER
jgi:hypothetical protein